MPKAQNIQKFQSLVYGSLSTAGLMSETKKIFYRKLSMNRECMSKQSQSSFEFFCNLHLQILSTASIVVSIVFVL